MRFLEIFGALSHTIPGNPGVRERRKRHAAGPTGAGNRSHSNGREG